MSELSPPAQAAVEPPQDPEPSPVRRWRTPAAVRFGRAAAVLLVGGLLLGVVEAWLWSRIAPAVRYQVFPNQSWAPLPTETQHIFVAVGIFAAIGVVTGVLVAVVGWSFRGIRGPLLLMVVGSTAALSALVAGRLGVAWVSGVDPATVAEVPGAQTVVTAPAVLTGWPAYLAAPTAAVLVYTVLVAWNGLADLGRDSAAPEPEPAANVRPAALLGHPAAATADPSQGWSSQPRPAGPAGNLPQQRRAGSEGPAG